MGKNKLITPKPAASSKKQLKKVENASAVQANSTKKKPITLQEKILSLLASADKPLGLASVKRLLHEKFDVEDTTTNNNRITKLLKSLSEEERNDFGKIGGSYHGGLTSPAYLAYSKEKQAEQDVLDEYERHKNELQCPFCQSWNDEDGTCLGEDSVARGGVHQCDQCTKLFYTWISDYHFDHKRNKPGNRVGHKTEYRYSGLYD